MDKKVQRKLTFDESASGGDMAYISIKCLGQNQAKSKYYCKTEQGAKKVSVTACQTGRLQ